MSKKIKISKADAKRICEGFQERENFQRNHEWDSVYHIEAWQEVNFIPGGVNFLRVHYIYNQTEKKAYFQDFQKKITLVAKKEEIKKLDDIIKRPIRAFNQGIFFRRLNRPNFQNHYRLFELLLLMNNRGDLISPRSSKETRRAYRERQKTSIKILFSIIISEK